jgi:nucleoid DNA-binding protein
MDSAGLDKEMSWQALRIFAETIGSHIAKHGSVHIEGLGRFSRHTDGTGETRMLLFTSDDK